MLTPINTLQVFSPLNFKCSSGQRDVNKGGKNKNCTKTKNHGSTKPSEFSGLNVLNFLDNCPLSPPTPLSFFHVYIAVTQKPRRWLDFKRRFPKKVPYMQPSLCWELEKYMLLENWHRLLARSCGWMHAILTFFFYPTCERSYFCERKCWGIMKNFVVGNVSVSVHDYYVYTWTCNFYGGHGGKCQWVIEEKCRLIESVA